MQSCVYSVCLCALQALKRKPDLFLCSNLDVKALFHCGEYCGHMVHTGTAPHPCAESSLQLLQLCERSSEGLGTVVLVWDGVSELWPLT